LKESEIRSLVGQVFAGRMAPDPSSLDLRRFPAANYIVFKDVMAATLEESSARMRTCKALLKDRGIEPLLMMDEEGGRVTQISGVFPPTPSSAALAHVLAPNEAGDLYAHLSRALAALGVDVNLAPCTDVNTEPLNPVIGTRSFGTDSDSVTRYAQAFIEASRPHIACIAKHFPGHGMTNVDSHLDLPLVAMAREDLESVHIAPFDAVIRLGIDGIMVSHCRYSAIQTDSHPASLSRDVVEGVLRKELGFDGLVITDSLDMDAVTLNMGAGEAARRALDAGVDMLLYTGDPKRFREAFETIVEDVVRGRITRGRLERSVLRRQAVLDRLAVRPSPTGPPPHRRYLELRHRVLSASVRMNDPTGILPLPGAPAACVTTNPDFVKDCDLQTAGLEEITAADQARDRVLLLWLLEPLRLGLNMETIHRMIEASRLSVVVTSYQALANLLDVCDAGIVTEDTTPETQCSILRGLFGQEPPQGKS
jgi:beta-glucosidase-like glycosyl hydrolase